MDLTPEPFTSLWRGSLLPLGCEAALILPMRSNMNTALAGFATAAPPSGSKLPRHKIKFALPWC
ncbi:hypothetical protein C3E98_010780 [Pseudomonas sp. MWU13-2625]|uniref:Uncharacterized protein n=1 Tax=Pseudomonas jessenii TaxID=77298 RepID=A0A5C4L0U7_PSEJE|nr:hypothetical protein C3E97_026885 [Pseudomonas sp. MWU12-2115]RBL71178.1 hypothetical protein C3E98_010780 [Pseudomonas sp. MWU13-2625]TNB97507.1 hypothetical protein FHG55_08325 [Pseudomonas jessenii]